MQPTTDLKDYYRFDNFINLTSNTQAIITAKQFADSPASLNNNILVITGIVGVGKTHLAVAILADVVAQKPDAAILQISYEKWWADFRQRDSDLFFERAKRLKIPFRDHLFDIDFLNQQDIILIDSYYPLKMDTPDKKRFHSSPHEMLQKIKTKLIITCCDNDFTLPHQHIEVKNLSTPAEIKQLIQYHMQQDNERIADEVVDYLCTLSYQSPRIMQGLWISLSAQSYLKKRPISIAFAKKIVGKWRERDLLDGVSGMSISNDTN
jgi:chromosomal replication initiation ATPase DnaA